MDPVRVISDHQRTTHGDRVGSMSREELYEA